MKTLGNIFIGIALFGALGGVLNTFWAENLLTPSTEALQQKTLSQMRSSVADGQNAAKYIEARTQSESLSSGKAGKPNKIAEEVIAKGQEDQEADLQSQEEKYTKTRNTRRTKMTLYFILAGLFGTTGAICRVSGKRKNDGIVSEFETKRCPFCDEPIRPAAKVCRFCNKDVTQADANSSKSKIFDAPLNSNSSREFLISRNNETSGPFTATQMREMVKERQIFPMDFVWYEGLEEWTQLYKIPEFTTSAPPVISAPAPPLNNNRPTPASDKENTRREDIELFAGKNGSYYADAWELDKFSPQPLLARRISWPAFFFGTLWLCHRKMYWYALVYAVCNFVIATIFDYVIFPNVFDSFSIAGLLGVYAWFLPSVWLATFGNQLYIKKAEKRIINVKREFRDFSSQRIKIAKKGGTSNVIVRIFAAITIIGILAGVALPVFQKVQVNVSVTRST